MATSPATVDAAARATSPPTPLPAKQAAPPWRRAYSTGISSAGLVLAAWGLLQLAQAERPLILALLIALAAVSEIAVTYAGRNQDTVAYEVGTAVSMAAIPLYGPAAAALAVVVSSLSFWLVKSSGTSWRQKNWEILRFNAGMHSLSIYVAGLVFQLLRAWLGPTNALAAILPWIPTALVYDQMNMWLLIVILRLTRGSAFRAGNFWRENRWAMAINIVVLSLGGFLMSMAVSQFEWVGIVVFFLPIALSSLAFRLYVRQMQAHMDNLEAIIAVRTDELHRLMREKDAFLAVLTHDMKSPLTSISIYASLIEKRPEIVLEKPHLAQAIGRSQETLLNIVNNILDLEKLQVTGAMPLELEDFDLLSLAEHVLESLGPQAMEKSITLQGAFDESFLPLQADRSQIERVLYNLVSNAIKYTPRGGHVCVRLPATADQAVVEVQDSGYGIPADELPLIFDRFRRVAKHKDKAGGTGLGLAITRAIVEAHGGHIAVSSEEGRGSTFTITLPRHQPPAI